MSLWENMRIEWRESDEKRDEGLKEPEDIQIYRSLDYKGGNITEELLIAAAKNESKYLVLGSDEYVNSSKFDLYKTNDDNAPTIVSVHGGGWFYGDKELYRFYCMYLCQKGFNVINFNYRLAPENAYPSAVEDVCILMNFLRDNKEALGLDMDNLFMVGDSAGASLANFYAIISSNKEYREKLGFITSDVKLKGVALNCGLYEMKECRDRVLKFQFIHAKLTEEDIYLHDNVLDFISKDYPPAYIMCSVNDGLYKKSKPLADKLEANKTYYEYKEYGQNNKESGHVFHLDLKNEEGTYCNEDEIRFFRSLI